MWMRNHDDDEKKNVTPVRMYTSTGTVSVKSAIKYQALVVCRMSKPTVSHHIYTHTKMFEDLQLHLEEYINL